MTYATNKTSTKRRLLLASDRSDQSRELAGILQSVGQVDTITTSDIPDRPARDLSGIVVDINLRSAESVQVVRNKLRADAYREMPRLFVLADALHHGSMQAWALGATDTIARPFDAEGILQRIRAAFPDSDGYDGLNGKQISDIVRLITIVDIYAALVEKRAYRLQFTHARAYAMMEEMGGKLDQHLLHAFRPVAFGYY